MCVLCCVLVVGLAAHKQRAHTHVCLDMSAGVRAGGQAGATDQPYSDDRSRPTIQFAMCKCSWYLLTYTLPIRSQAGAEDSISIRIIIQNVFIESGQLKSKSRRQHSGFKCVNTFKTRLNRCTNWWNTKRSRDDRQTCTVY
jgi:hypothetical protein